jgi:hypothetical protein
MELLLHTVQHIPPIRSNIIVLSGLRCVNLKGSQCEQDSSAVYTFRTACSHRPGSHKRSVMPLPARPSGVVLLAFVCVLNSLPAVEVSAETLRLSPQDDWFRVLSGPSLSPGDEVVLSAGTYTDARKLVIRQQGTEDKPIVFRAAEGARVVFRRPDRRQNSINLDQCQYFQLSGIEITGGATGIRIGGSPERPAKHITLEGLHIHNVGGNGVTANFPGQTYERMIFRRNHIHHTEGHGEAFYLGSNNDDEGKTTGYLFNSFIEGNYIHDLGGPTVSQGDGIELKDGCYGNVVRDNVIHDTNYPGIIVYGADGKAPNVIERNVIWNSGDHGIQAAADAIVRNNVIFDVKGFGIYCRAHQSARVGRMKIVHNTIKNPRSIRIIPNASGHLDEIVLLANNAFSGQTRLPDVKELMRFGNVSGIDSLFPAEGSPVIGAADDRYVSLEDFNATRREGSADAGAYRYAPSGNPGWKIQPGFKE